MLWQSTFSAANATQEIFVTGQAPAKGDFAAELDELIRELCETASGKNLVWVRFHVSDIANQYGTLVDKVKPLNCFVAAVSQRPVGGGHVALEAYIVDRGALDGTRRCMMLALEHYRMLFFRNEFSGADGSGAQMRREWNATAEELRRYDGTVAHNLHRTWIYCRDIDNNYAPLVTARRNFFDGIGLTEHSHYIASTGIEGISEPFNRLVRMDHFALFGHEEAQIEYMHAPEMLSPTHIYGVTFERGTRIIYGDRSHYFISGTASIDKDGRIVHPCDVTRQAERMVQNVAALLENHQGSLEDMRQAVVYLRDPADAGRAEDALRSLLPKKLPRITVCGTVCRPGWLIEIDGIAVNGAGDQRFAPLA